MIIPVNQIKFEIFDKYGNLEFKKEVLMQSFLSNWINWVRGVFVGANVTIKDTGGTNRSNPIQQTLNLLGPEGNVNYGIRVGTGTTAVAIDNYAIETPIAHGNGGGQLYHKVTTVSATTTAGSSSYITIQRNLDNNSGGTITVQEAGVIGYNSGSGWYFLLARDITGAIAIGNTKTFVATYTYQTTV